MPHTFLNPSVRIPLGDGVTLIIKLLAFGQSQFHFTPAILKVKSQWHQSIAFPLLQPDPFGDLLLVHQELTDAQRVFIVNIPLFIRINMHLINENLTVVNIGKTFLQKLL